MSADRDAILAIKLATLQLRLYTFADALELRYAPDQPRVPAGNPDGGQWADGGTSVGKRTGGSRLLRIATELTPLGSLHTQMRLRDGSLLCVYDFGLQHWMIPSATRTIGCPGLMTQSIFAYGVQLNDNYRLQR